MYKNILTYQNPKTLKGRDKGYLTGILHLAPSSSSGYQVCPNASPGCISACLNTAGRGRFDKVQTARKQKTERFFNDREAFILDLEKSILSIIRKAKREGLIPCIRLNGTSDLNWLPFGLIQRFPDVQFYDYTKNPHMLNRDLPSNYHLTFSLSEINETEAQEALSKGFNVAIVFRGSLPLQFWGRPVIDGTETDLRFLDPQGVIVGLKEKGRAKKDESGFVHIGRMGTQDEK